MADQTNEWKEAMIAAADRAVEIVLAQRGYHTDRATSAEGFRFGTAEGDGTYNQFSTGYDSGSGLTTFVFRLDLSELDGADLLA